LISADASVRGGRKPTKGI